MSIIHIHIHRGGTRDSLDTPDEKLLRDLEMKYGANPSKALREKIEALREKLRSAPSVPKKDSDGAPVRRAYPGYTLSQLKEMHKNNPNEKIAAEIATREAGTSAVFKVPQIGGGKPINKIGRM